MELMINWSEISDRLLRLAVAFVLSLPVAWHREKKTRSLGLRTYPLVAIGACAFILTGDSLFDTQGEANARIFHGVITGMGFIGGGAILKNGNQVSGTANAASLWCTGAIGVAVAYGRIEIAILLSITIFLIFVLKPVISDDKKIDESIN